MSTTESTAITRLIAEANRVAGQELEPPKRVARGTVSPQAPLQVAAPVPVPMPMIEEPPLLNTSELELEEDEEGVSEDVEIGADLDEPPAQAAQGTPAPQLLGGASFQARSLLRSSGASPWDDEQTVTSGPADVVASTPPPAAPPVAARPPSVIVEGSAELAVIRNTPPPGTRPVAVPAAPVLQMPAVFEPTPRTEETETFEPPTPARGSRKLVWMGLFCAVVGGALIGVTGVKALTGQEETPALTVAAEKPAEPAVARPEPAPAAAPAVAPPPVEAAPATSGLELPGISASTQVSLDGRSLGQGPMRVLQLTAGKHELELASADGAQKSSQTIELVADQVLRLDARDPEAARPAPEPEMARAETAPEPTASAKDEDEPEEAEEAPVPARARAKADAPRVKKAPDKKVARVDAAPPRGKGFLLVNAKPPCEILVDGKRTGLSTPQRNLPLPAGTHTIVLVNSEHRIKKTAKVKVTAGEASRLIVDLTDQMR